MRRRWLWIAGLGLLAAGALGAVFFATRTVQVVVIGTDDLDFSKHADTIILVSFTPAAKRLVLLSLPRDTVVQHPEKGRMKLGEVMAYGWTRGGVRRGAEEVLARVSELLGIPLRHYCHVNYRAFEQIVDAVGGVTVDIPAPMVYQDRAAGLEIRLPAGRQRLTGKKALEYVRFRGDRQGDLGRIHRQQQFLAALRQRVRPGDIPSLARQLSGTITTNVGIMDLAVAGKRALGQAGALTVQMLPGEPWRMDGVSYFRPDLQKVAALRGTLW